MANTRRFSADLSARRALITGGSRGIAAQIARDLVYNNAAVAVNYSSDADARAGFPNAARDLIAELNGGRRVVCLEADLSSPDPASVLVDRAVDALDGLDVLILSASAQINKPILDQSTAEIVSQLQFNLVSNISLIQKAIPIMKKQGFGRIITLGSVQEIAPSAEMPIYSMTKAALLNLVRNLAVQTAPFGITVNNIAPGLIQTDRNAHRRLDGASWTKLSSNANPMGRAGQPNDISGAVLYLASESSCFTTGTTIYITGGGHVGLNRADGPPGRLSDIGG